MVASKSDFRTTRPSASNQEFVHIWWLGSWRHVLVFHQISHLFKHIDNVFQKPSQLHADSSIEGTSSVLRHQSRWTNFEQVFTRYWHHGRAVTRYIFRRSLTNSVCMWISRSFVHSKSLGYFSGHHFCGDIYFNRSLLPQVSS